MTNEYIRNMSNKNEIQFSDREVKLLLTALDWFEDEYPTRHKEQSRGKIHEARRMKAKIQSLREKLEEASEE